MTRVIVTGANGFVGREACRHLLRAGLNVGGLVRSGTPPLPAGIVRHAVDSLHDPAVGRTFRGADAVVHLAARAHVMREKSSDPLAEFREVNVRGTEAALAAAIDSGVRCFVFISSVKAVGESTSAPIDERTPPHPLDPYGQSKLEAELLVSRMGASAAIRTPVLRLPLVYGPGVKGNMLRLFQLVDLGIPLPFGGLRNRRSLVNTGNVASAIERVIVEDSAGSGTYFVSDREPVSTAELIKTIGRALGKEARLLPAPETLLRLGGKLGDRIASMAPVPLTTPIVDRLIGSLVVDSSLLANATGWQPRVTLADGLRETADWFRRRERTE